MSIRFARRLTFISFLADRVSRILPLILAAIACLAQSAQATLLLYEPFSYSNGTKFGTGLITNGWVAGNSISSGWESAYATNAATLSYSSLVNKSGSLGLMIAGSPASNRNAGCTNFLPQTIGSGNPAIYASFLLNVQSPTTNASSRMLVGLSTGTSATPAIAAGVCINSANQLYVTKTSFTPDTSPTAALSAGTHLVVMRYLWNSDDHYADLWVDPASLGTTEAKVPASNANSLANDNISSSVKAVYITQLTGYSGTYFIDELRVGTTWADVTTSANPVQAVSPTNSSMTVSPASTNVNASVLITVTERDANYLAMTNDGVAPVLSAPAGALGAVNTLGHGIFTATLTTTNAGNVSVAGTISGTPIGNGAGVSVYFGALVGTNGNFYVGGGFYPGTYNITFSAEPGQSYSVWSTPNLGLPMTQWTPETDLATGNTTMYETAYPGSLSSYAFTVQPPASGPVFYRVSSP